MNNIDATARVRKIVAYRKRQLGSLGEMLIVKHLVTRGFTHVCSNYRRKYGEIDLIFNRNGRIHFVEVKTVSREIAVKPHINTLNNRSNVIHETSHRPEDNVSQVKRRKIARMIETYLAEHGGHDREWQFDVATVYLSRRKKLAIIKFIKDIQIDAMSFK